MTFADTASAVGIGIFAGAIGTAAMTVSSTVEAKLRERESSSPPADAAGILLGGKPRDEAGEARFTQIVHCGHATAWGAARGLPHAARVDGLAGTALHFDAVSGSEQATLPALNTAPPLWESPSEEVLIDAFDHAPYATATSAAFSALQRSAS